MPARIDATPEARDGWILPQRSRNLLTLSQIQWAGQRGCVGRWPVLQEPMGAPHLPPKKSFQGREENKQSSANVHLAFRSGLAEGNSSRPGSWPSDLQMNNVSASTTLARVGVESHRGRPGHRARSGRPAVLLPDPPCLVPAGPPAPALASLPSWDGSCAFPSPLAP